MNITKGLLLVALTAGIPSAVPAQDPACNATYAMFDMLDFEFAERPAYRANIANGVPGLTSNSRLTITLNPVTQTWTMVVTRNNGTSCLVAEGTLWNAVGDGDA